MKRNKRVTGKDLSDGIRWILSKAILFHLSIYFMWLHVAAKEVQGLMWSLELFTFPAAERKPFTHPDGVPTVPVLSLQHRKASSPGLYHKRHSASDGGR